MNYFRKMFWLKFRYSLILTGEKRTVFLKRHRVFYSMGEKCHFQPRNLPADPQLIKLGNNVSVASDVVFITHDIIHNVFNNCGGGKSFILT